MALTQEALSTERWESSIKEAISSRIQRRVDASDPDLRKTRPRPATMPGLNPGPQRSIQGS